MSKIEKHLRPDVLDAVVADMAECKVPVREDLYRVHALILSRISRPGSWWTGLERIAIAAESRAAVGCAFCQVRKEAISPYTVEGKHDTDPLYEGVLPEPIIDMMHMVINDATRITKAAIDKMASAGITDGHYVEALGIVVAIRSLDQTCRGLGVPLHELPSPLDGAPSKHRPAPLVEGEAFIPVLAREAPEAPDDDLWTAESAPMVPNVSRALSLVPDALRDWGALSNVQYMPSHLIKAGNMTDGRNLSRPQIELIAARVSALNDCFY